MKREFQKTLREAVYPFSQVDETCELVDIKDTKVQSNSPPKVTCTHNQHLAHYV